MKTKTFYVTTPIYYPSAQLHIGHVYSTTIAWVLRNYKKLHGYKTKFLTGSDEHGQKIAISAAERQISPQQFVDNMADKFKKLWHDLEIDFDYFSRTTSKKHQKIVNNIFNQLLNSQNIYESYYQGLYSIADEEFLTKTQAKKINNEYYHPISGHKLANVKEDSYFLNLKKYQKWLDNYWYEHSDFVIPEKVVNELKNNFLSLGLDDLSITRTSFDWGIKVKDNSKHVIYVWLDALSNYISALGYSTSDDKDFRIFWEQGDEIVHVVGKEISRFHAIYWPIMLEALHLRKPTTIFAHGWLITKEGKMSKSKGNVISPYDLLKTFEPEVIKYYFASQIHHGDDGVFSYDLLKNVYNADLANNFGNLLSRATTLSEKHFKHGLKDFHASEQDQYIDKQTISEIITKSFEKYLEYFDRFQIDQALKVAIQLSKILNNYIEIKAPWSLTNDLQSLSNVLHNLFNGIYAIASMLQVVMPRKMALVQEILQVRSLDYALITDFYKFKNTQIIKLSSLFKRL